MLCRRSFLYVDIKFKNEHMFYWMFTYWWNQTEKRMVKINKMTTKYVPDHFLFTLFLSTWIVDVVVTGFFNKIEFHLFFKFFRHLVASFCLLVFISPKLSKCQIFSIHHLWYFQQASFLMKHTSLVYWFFCFILA